MTTPDPADMGEVVERLAKKATPILEAVRAGEHPSDIRRVGEMLDGSWDQDFPTALLGLPQLVLSHLTRQEAEIKRLTDWADGFSDAQLKERATGEAYQKELREEIKWLRVRLFANHQAGGNDHSTACSIWGDNGQGGTKEGFEEPLPCNCGALRNFERARAEAAESALSRLSGAVGKVVEAGRKIVALRDPVAADLRARHSARGDAASSWMREDDRDLRENFRAGMDALSSALTDLQTCSDTTFQSGAREPAGAVSQDGGGET